MTTSVFHGHQSCLEPGFIEPQILTLKLTPPTSIFPQTSNSPNPPPAHSVPQHKTHSNPDFTPPNAETGGWESLLSLTNTNESAVYIHPLAKRSESLLSDKSLEMCTESLGSETGTDSIDDFPNRDLGEVGLTAARRRFIARGGARLPPPLPLIGGVRVRPHREGGRLVLMAVEIDSLQSCFKAERANGRLRLCFAASFEDGDENRGEDMVGIFENVEGDIAISPCEEDENRMNLEELFASS